MIRRRVETAVSKDQRLVLVNVSWEEYLAVREATDHHPGLRMTYLDGMLEIVSPGERHETVKKMFARLLELWALEKGIDIYPYGSTTYKEKRKKVGHEPDECYTVGAKKPIPDFAFETVVTSGGIKKLKAYRRLGVTEVLFWKKGRFLLYRLFGKRYRAIERSEFFPEFDLALVASLIESPRPQIEILREFRDRIRSV